MAIQFKQMIDQLLRCEKAGATTACVMQIYVYIDALAYLGMPINRTKNTKVDFIDWVDSHLKAEAIQPYQYRGIDVYGARCAVLHTFGSEADFHQQNPTAIMFGYTDGGRHYFDQAVNPKLAIIGTASLITDFVAAVGSFIVSLKPRVAVPSELSVLEERLKKIMSCLPFPETSA